MRRRLATLIVSVLLCFPLIAPSVTGDWGSDTWLSSVIATERLESGDEFGCHGYEGVDTTEENWVIASCKEYLEGHTNASRWGASPVSFGINAESVDVQTGKSLINSGFHIVGDMVKEAPEGLSIAKRNGASLERGVADKTLISSAEKDTLVSIHWRARIDDLRVREDNNVISWLEDQQVWFTTWGEWHHHRSSGMSTSAVLEGSTVTIESSADTSGMSSWAVPGTLMVKFDSSVLSVSDSEGQEFPLLLVDDRKLTLGWRPVEGGIIVTQAPLTTVIVELEGNPEHIETSPMITFNDLNYSVTIVGHHTTNLFRWTQDFSDSGLTFTWLIERPSDDIFGWKLPLFAASMVIAVPLSIVYLLRNDQFSHSMNQNS